MDPSNVSLLTSQNIENNLFEEPIPQKIVRPDRNLEKWPLWEPSNSRSDPKTRLIQREIRLPDGSTVIAKVEVGYSNKGCLTTEDQKTCYALIKYWEESGRPTDNVYFSRQQLARILKKQWGSKVNSSLTASLMRLRFTPFTWERSYFDSSTHETIERIETFNILAELQLTRRSKDGHTTRETSVFRFNELILKNLLANYTKPVFLDTILSFQSEIAQLLYTHLDLVMSDKSRYERKTQALFEDLGLDGTAYRYPSKRAQMLEPALRELQGQPLPTGCLKSVHLEKTVDGKDFKIVVQKSPRVPTRTRATVRDTPQSQSVLPFAESEKPMFLPGKKEPDSAATEQVKHFYAVFFQSGDSAQPTAKELVLAQSHLDRLGKEKARYFVQFAFEEAKKTKFAIQNYAGIGQYEGRAVAQYEAKVKKQQTEKENKARQSHEEHCLPAYQNYLKECYAQMERTPSDAFQRFQNKEAALQQKLSVGAMAKHPTMQRILRDFNRDEDQLKRFVEHFATEGEGQILAFWQWDAMFNPNAFVASAPRPASKKISDVR